jgi:hypothetical protein
LIAAEHDTATVHLDAIGYCRDTAVRDTERTHFETGVRQDGLGGGGRGVDDDNVQSDALPGLTERSTEDREGAATGIEQPPEERIERGKGTSARGTRNLQRLLTRQFAEPEQRRQVGDVVGMKVTDGEQGHILKPRARLAETQKRPAANVDHRHGPATAPDEITGGRARASRRRAA